jgi:hypothetical protein
MDAAALRAPPGAQMVAAGAGAAPSAPVPALTQHQPAVLAASLLCLGPLAEPELPSALRQALIALPLGTAASAGSLPEVRSALRHAAAAPARPAVRRAHRCARMTTVASNAVTTGPTIMRIAWASNVIRWASPRGMAARWQAPAARSGAHQLSARFAGRESGADAPPGRAEAGRRAPKLVSEPLSRAARVSAAGGTPARRAARRQKTYLGLGAAKPPVAPRGGPFPALAAAASRANTCRTPRQRSTAGRTRRRRGTRA